MMLELSYDEEELVFDLHARSRKVSPGCIAATVVALRMIHKAKEREKQDPVPQGVKVRKWWEELV